VGAKRLEFRGGKRTEKVDKLGREHRPDWEGGETLLGRVKKGGKVRKNQGGEKTPNQGNPFRKSGPCRREANWDG